MENKRRSVRASTNLVASFKVQNTRLARGSRIKDISETGLCIPLNNYFPVGSILEVEMRSLDLKGSIKSLARVVRIAKPADNVAPFEMGAEFIDFSVANWRIFLDYLHRSIHNLYDLNNRDTLTF